MTNVETKVTLSISEEGLTLGTLSDQIGAALQKAGRELMTQACQVIEAQALEAQGPGVQRRKRRGRHLLTRFGWMKLKRWQTWDPENGYAYPLDRVLRLRRQDRASPWILRQAVALATRLPYRQATYLLGTFIDEELDHRTLYRWVQKLGAQIVLEEDDQQQAVFRDGVIPERDPTEREIILAEVDGTFLKSQREEGSQFEVRLGVLTTGRQLVSSTAKHKRYRLLERVRYGGVEAAQDFGERLFLKGEAHLGLSHAGHILLVGDGADWIEALAGHDRWRATYQLDWWHLTHAIRRTFPDHPKVANRLIKHLYRGQGRKILPAVRLAKRNGVGDPEQVETLLGYLETNQEGFYGAHSLKDELSPEGRRVCVVGSGAVEKHVDLTIDRRFKGQGMRWTRKGANRLLKLRIGELDRAA
jgi:Uncharacterised protein family (UPF0236)